jgi:ABC-type sugar transport system permease subunit
MPFWQRILITIAVMLVTSFLVGLLWRWLFNTDIPSYLGGAVGGLTAVPT